jgi:hypothetical protein
MNRQLHLWFERIIVFLMLAGIVGMFQPWSIELYGIGFHMLLVGTLAFIVISHVSVKAETN